MRSRDAHCRFGAALRRGQRVRIVSSGAALVAAFAFVAFAACVAFFAAPAAAEASEGRNDPGPRASPGAAPLVLVDDAGRRIELLRRPKRIVSLAPHATELLFAVGAGARVVAVDPASDEPPEAKMLPKFSGYPQLDAEALFALVPDLVVLWGPGVSRAQLERLESLDIAVFVSHPRKLDDIASTLRRLARLAPDPAPGVAAADAFEAQLASIRARYAERRAVRVFVQIWSSPLYTVSDADPIDDALRSCGGVNVFGDVGIAAPQVDAEGVIARRPELIIASDRSPSPRRWADLGLLAPRGPARFVVFDASRFERPGPRSLDALRRLCDEIDTVRSSLPR